MSIDFDELLSGTEYWSAREKVDSVYNTSHVFLRTDSWMPKLIFEHEGMVPLVNLGVKWPSAKQLFELFIGDFYGRVPSWNIKGGEVDLFRVE